VSTATVPRSTERERETAARIESLAARLLTWGTRIALALILVGVVGLIVTGVDPITAIAPGYSLGAIPGQLLALEPQGFLWAGLTVLIALPIGRVVVSGAGFLAAGDRRLALVSALVILVIIVSVVAALGLGH
jgi:uncharacterized membrane protein